VDDDIEDAEMGYEIALSRIFEILALLIILLVRIRNLLDY
jgi:hypothetical protein